MIHHQRTGANPAPGPDQVLSSRTSAGLGDGSGGGGGGGEGLRGGPGGSGRPRHGNPDMLQRGSIWNESGDVFWRGLAASAEGGQQPLTMSRAPAASLPECRLASAGRPRLDKRKQKGLILRRLEGGCRERRRRRPHRRRCPPPPPAGWPWSRPCPTLKRPWSRKTKRRAAVAETER